jgi:hypothetical protein
MPIYRHRKYLFRLLTRKDLKINEPTINIHALAFLCWLLFLFAAGLCLVIPTLSGDGSDLYQRDGYATNLVLAQ